MRDRIQSPSDFGALVRRRRAELQLTQEDVAAVARVTPRLLGELEKGKETAQLAGALRILAALGLDLYAEGR